MAYWKSVICVVILAEIHYCQSILYEQAAVSRKPEYYSYFIDTSPINPLVQCTHVYLDKRHDRSSADNVGCPRTFSHPETDHKADHKTRVPDPEPKSNRIGYLQEEDTDYDRKHTRHQIKNPYARGVRSTIQRKSNSNNRDCKEYPNSSLRLHNKLEVPPATSHGEAKGNEKNRQEGRQNDKDEHKHSNLAKAREHEHDRQNPGTDHNTHRKRSKAHSSPRVSSRDHSSPQPKTLYDKKQILTNMNNNSKLS